MTDTRLSGTSTEPVIAVSDLEVTFKGNRKIGRKSPLVRAVNRVSFEIAQGEALGLVGESGSGKSTVGRAISRLVKSDSGSIRLLGTSIEGLRERDMRPWRPHIQMVFQDPYSSLDPSMPISESIAEPLIVHKKMGRRDRLIRVRELLDLVGLSTHHLNRYPYEFSGGQRQRIAIARAIATDPRLLILDEAVSALDVSTQHQIVQLLESLRSQLNLAYLFIAHDLAVVRQISDRVAVMYLGCIVEEGPRQAIFESPAHPYTKALLSAVPIAHPKAQRNRERIVLSGDLPSPTNLPSGCVFATRCPHVMDVCLDTPPTAQMLTSGSHVRCHLHDGRGLLPVVP